MDSTGIRANMSAQHLINHEVHPERYLSSRMNPSGGEGGQPAGSSGSSSLSSSNTKLDGKESASSGASASSSPPLTKRQIISVSILCFVNLINYMDRYTIAGEELILSL